MNLSSTQRIPTTLNLFPFMECPCCQSRFELTPAVFLATDPEQRCPSCLQMLHISKVDRVEDGVTYLTLRPR